MKKLILAMCFLFAGFAFAQEAEQMEIETSEMANSEITQVAYNLLEPTGYILNNQKFNFVPDVHGINVLKIENGEEIEYGTLRKSSEDGLYILTCTADTDDVSFGRFDEDGNFHCNRFDMETETIVEENYTLADIN